MKRKEYASPVIADRIQQVFDDNDLSDGYVAKILDMDRKTPLQYRHGVSNPSIKFIRWLCATYHVSVEWLLDLEK